MKKSTIVTLILGSLLGGAVTHNFIKNKDVYKACYEVGKEIGENAANKILTKVNKKLDKKKTIKIGYSEVDPDDLNEQIRQKKHIYDNEPEIHPIEDTRDGCDYIPIEHFFNETSTYAEVVERVNNSRYIENSVLYDNKYNISKVYIDPIDDKPIGIEFNSPEDRDEALELILGAFFNISKSKALVPYGIDVEVFDELFGMHLYSDYFEDIGNAIYFWPTRAGFVAFQRDLKKIFASNGNKHMIYFGVHTPCSDLSIVLNYHHLVDRFHIPKGIVSDFDKDELPVKINFFNEEDAKTCYDEIASFIDSFDRFSYYSLKKILALSYNIYIHGDYTDVKMYCTDVYADLDDCTLRLEWIKEEDSENV